APLLSAPPAPRPLDKALRAAAGSPRVPGIPKNLVDIIDISPVVAARGGNMNAISPEKHTPSAWVEANQKRLSDCELDIWRYAETAFREYKSARAYCDLLRKEGFQVEEGSAEMPTAFLATFGEGRPVLGSYAEYDAVPENSQEPVPYRSPRKGLHPWAP